jgi:hypothetical protein
MSTDPLPAEVALGYDPWWAGGGRDGAAFVAGHTLVIDEGTVR